MTEEFCSMLSSSLFICNNITPTRNLSW